MAEFFFNPLLPIPLYGLVPLSLLLTTLPRILLLLLLGLLWLLFVFLLFLPPLFLFLLFLFLLRLVLPASLAPFLLLALLVFLVLLPLFSLLVGSLPFAKFSGSSRCAVVRAKNIRRHRSILRWA